MAEVQVRTVTNRDDLIKHIDEITAAVCQIFHEIPDEYLFSAAEPDGWSIEKNMKHIASTNRLMSRWIRMPRFLLALRGKPKQGLKIESIPATNRPNIHEYGGYPHPGTVPVGRKAELIAEIEKSAETLKKAVLKRTDEELEKYQGMFGGMNLRVFTLFTLKHGLHHAGVVKARMRG